jgi:hypothetical protein
MIRPGGFGAHGMDGCVFILRRTKALCQTIAMGHELPRHLAERAAVMPPKAAAPGQQRRFAPQREVTDLHYEA